MKNDSRNYFRQNSVGLNVSITGCLLCTSPAQVERASFRTVEGVLGALSSVNVAILQWYKNKNKFLKSIVASKRTANKTQQLFFFYSIDLKFKRLNHNNKGCWLETQNKEPQDPETVQMTPLFRLTRAALKGSRHIRFHTCILGFYYNMSKASMSNIPSV